ncbi:MAG: transcription termination factor Rho [Clostridiales bacterium]|nr:transcription termination factor Rho [Clostridiales bacterium]
MNKVINKDTLSKMGIFELREFARSVGVDSPTVYKKDVLIDKIMAVLEGEITPKPRSKRGRPPKPLITARTDLSYINTPVAPVEKTNGVLSDSATSEYEEFEEREGILEIHNDGYGFIRVNNYEPSEKDAYVSNQLIKKYRLRKGDMIKGQVRKLRDEKQNAIVNILSINGVRPEDTLKRVNFDDLIPIYPNERFKLELPNSRYDIAIRSIDLIAPIGKGQRGMIVSPPKAGKTTLLKKIATSIAANHPEAHLMVLLIDERPEEVTDMQRSTKGEVIYSTFDESPEHHTRAAELVLARAKRLVEMKKDVVILLDSLTRLARAYNLTIPPTGRTLSGGIDPGALYSPKRFFGSARNIENGGSLTIIATALIDTGSRMDDVIYEEFKGTGNMEIHLDRRLSEKRIFPAIDLAKSSTRREELLLSQKELEGIWSIRRILSVGDTQEATEQLITMMSKTNNNLEFIDNLQLWLKNL